MSIKYDHDIYLIDWIDAQASGGWASKEDYEQMSVTPCHSVGFKLCEDKLSITLTQSLDPSNDNCSESIAIPRVCILKQTKLVPTRTVSKPATPKAKGKRSTKKS